MSPNNSANMATSASKPNASLLAATVASAGVAAPPNSAPVLNTASATLLPTPPDSAESPHTSSTSTTEPDTEPLHIIITDKERYLPETSLLTEGEITFGTTMGRACYEAESTFSEQRGYRVVLTLSGKQLVKDTVLVESDDWLKEPICLQGAMKATVSLEFPWEDKIKKTTLVVQDTFGGVKVGQLVRFLVESTPRWKARLVEVQEDPDVTECLRENAIEAAEYEKTHPPPTEEELEQMRREEEEMMELIRREEEEEEERSRLAQFKKSPGVYLVPEDVVVGEKKDPLIGLEDLMQIDGRTTRDGLKKIKGEEKSRKRYRADDDDDDGEGDGKDEEHNQGRSVKKRKIVPNKKPSLAPRKKAQHKRLRSRSRSLSQEL